MTQAWPLVQPGSERKVSAGRTDLEGAAVEGGTGVGGRVGRRGERHRAQVVQGQRMAVPAVQGRAVEGDRAEQALGRADARAVVDAAHVLDEHVQRGARRAGPARAGSRRGVRAPVRRRGRRPRRPGRGRRLRPRSAAGRRRGPGRWCGTGRNPVRRPSSSVVTGSASVRTGLARAVTCGSSGARRSNSTGVSGKFGRRSRGGLVGDRGVAGDDLAEGVVLGARVAALGERGVVVVGRDGGLVGVLVVGAVGEAEVGAAVEHVDVDGGARGQQPVQVGGGVGRVAARGAARPSGRTSRSRTPRTSAGLRAGGRGARPGTPRPGCRRCRWRGCRAGCRPPGARRWPGRR